MQFTDFKSLDISTLPSPCFVVDEVALIRNLKILHEVEEKSGAKILHALKAFSMWSLAEYTTKYVSGTCASGLHEAKLGQEYYGGEVHVFSAAYKEDDLKQLLDFANHIVFNSCSQLLHFESICREAKAKRPNIKFGLRVNPQHSEGDVPLYDPCAPGSRLGTTRQELDKYLAQEDFKSAFTLVSGLHFHTLCEQKFQPLKRTLNAVEEQFSDLFESLEWVDFGGGHHITAPDYEVQKLIDCIKTFSAKHDVQVYLEPGEAVAIGTGILVSEVLDIIQSGELNYLIIDTSATCHMPDTLEMPYRADITGSGLPEEKKYTYRLGSQSCLAGDVIGEYSFDKPIQVGQRLIFEDMAHYTMVKTTTFNGINLPSIAIWNSETDKLKIVRQFGYDDFKGRLS
ncbi:MAG: carboxynorspermidine decarboxylase [Kiritimatiellae bacterium]|jgi:carboxynorspermidine decarboxylase|nr:carboxynorspermidine decarboxylase [Kiritimatiellia bacterium]